MLWRFAIHLVPLVLLAACGGGGSQSQSLPIDVADPPQNSMTFGPRTPGAFQTEEFQRNWGLGAINVASRYADGGTGDGTLAAVFDTGADVRHPDLAGNLVDALSHSYYTGTSDVRDQSGHGTHVAGIIAARKNDVGTHGVAFDSKLMILQGLGRDGPRESGLLASWADANRRAIDAGARSINHSWTFVRRDGTIPTIADFETRAELESYLGGSVVRSLEEARKAGLVSVFAAGNAGLAQPSNSSGMAVLLPELGDTTLAVVALDKAGRIADFSNRCGIAADTCLAAPGTNILSTLPGNEVGSYSGTSMAAPHVTGAVNVLASNFPELTGSEITRILRDTARDLGATGVDPVYGHGALDLRNAVAPQGQITLQTSDDLGAAAVPAQGSYVAASGGLARSLAASFRGTGVMVTDGYERGYSAGLDGFVSAGHDGRAGENLARFTLGGGELSPYAALTEAGRDVTLRGETDSGASVALSGSEGPGGSYLAVQGRRSFGPSALSLEIGGVQESGSLLGARTEGAFGEDLSTTTGFAKLGADLETARDQSLSLAVSTGTSRFSGSGFLAQGHGIGTRSISATYHVENAFGGSGRLSLGAAREMSVTGGELEVEVPSGLAAAQGGERVGEVAMTRHDIDLDSAAAPVDLSIRYERPALGGRLAAGANWADEEGGALDLSAGFSLRF